MIPTEKISLWGEYKFYLRDSMGMYNGVPTLNFDLIYVSEKIAKPKSAIFQPFFPFKIFAGLISLWMIPFCSKYFKPSAICCVISIIWSCAIESYEFLLLLMYSIRHPSGQYSVMM